MGKLSARQEAFVAEYVKDRNAARAAIRAGYSPKTARQQGHRLLTNVDIAAAVERALEERGATMEGNDRERGTRMTEQTEQKTGPGLERKTLEDLDREAREALDRLADKREELERRHRETELAAGRQREREEERRREEERKAEETEQRRRLEEAERLGKQRLILEERAEEQAKALAATLKELLTLDPVHRRAVAAAFGKAPKQLFDRTFAQELGDWFNGRFKEVIRGIGGDLRAEYGKQGPALPERDALPAPLVKPAARSNR